MYFKQKLAYMALGCLFTIIGYILASLGGDVDVQAQGDESEPTVIDQIVCRQLRVVNDDGETVVEIMDLLGGFIGVKRPNGKAVVLIHTDSNGGYMSIHHASGEEAIRLADDEYGGGMAIFNKGGKNVLQASVGNMGGGMFITNDKHGYRTGRLP